MTTELLQIGSGDGSAHELFHAFVPLTFRSVDFRLWEARGGWNADYEAFLLRHDGDIVASIGCSRMQLWVAGVRCEGWQLGAVATHPQQRGRGWSRRLMQAVLARIDAHAQPVLLFANEQVRDFYPRFGFRPVAQQRYVADLRIACGGALPPRCDVASEAQRERLAALCRRALAHDPQFGAEDYYPTLLWHLSYRALRAHWLDDVDGLAVVSEDDGTLHLHEVLAPQRFDLSAVLPRLTQRPVQRVEFRFQPHHWWPQARDAGEYGGSPLFVRSLDALAPGALRFPDLAQT